MRFLTKTLPDTVHIFVLLCFSLKLVSLTKECLPFVVLEVIVELRFVDGRVVIDWSKMPLDFWVSRLLTLNVNG